MRSLEKVVVDDEVVLFTVSDSDFEYNFRLNEYCKVVTKRGGILDGVITEIGSTYLELKSMIVIPFEVVRSIERMEV